MKFDRLEEFADKYESFVRNWFDYNNYYKLKFDPFWQDFLIKIEKNKDLDKYSQTHESTAQFDTWLKVLLKNFYIDQWRKLQAKQAQVWDKYESLESDGSEKDEERVHNLRHQILKQEVEEAEENIRYDFSLEKVAHLIDEIENDKFRIVVKLKYFHQKYLPLNNKDYIYIEKKSGLSKEKIEDFLLENQKQPFGMKNKDISILLKLSMGYISATCKRVVTKFIEEPYRN